MREVTLIVRLSVGYVDGSDIPAGVAIDAAKEAVTNVLKHAEGIGFPHEREDTVSIELDSVQA